MNRQTPLRKRPSIFIVCTIEDKISSHVLSLNHLLYKTMLDIERLESIVGYIILLYFEAKEDSIGRGHNGICLQNNMFHTDDCWLCPMR